MTPQLSRRQRWAGWIMIFILTWLVATTAGVLVFAPRTPFVVKDPAPDVPAAAVSPSRAVASFPGCVVSADWPKNRPADWVVVAWPDNRVSPMSFAEAWTRGTNTIHTDDVWVLGVCYRDPRGQK